MANLGPAFEAIADELTSQYSIDYYPTNRKHDGKYRKLKVKVTRPGLNVNTREGYWAPRDSVFRVP